MTKEKKQEIIKAFGKHVGDTGSSSVQVALLTARINQLTEHFKQHKKDHASRRGLLMLVGHRSTLLRYMKKHEPDDYAATVEKLGLRR